MWLRYTLHRAPGRSQQRGSGYSRSTGVGRKLCCAVPSYCHFWLFVTPRTAVHQAPMSMGFSRQEYQRGCHAFLQGNPPNPGIKPRSSALQVDSLPTEPPGSPGTLERGAYPSSSGSSQPRNRTGVSCIAGGFFTSWATGKPLRRLWAESKMQISCIQVQTPNVPLMRCTTLTCVLNLSISSFLTCKMAIIRPTS